VFSVINFPIFSSVKLTPQIVEDVVNCDIQICDSKLVKIPPTTNHRCFVKQINLTLSLILSGCPIHEAFKLSLNAFYTNIIRLARLWQFHDLPQVKI